MSACRPSPKGNRKSRLHLLACVARSRSLRCPHQPCRSCGWCHRCDCGDSSCCAWPHDCIIVRPHSKSSVSSYAEPEGDVARRTRVAASLRLLTVSAFAGLTAQSARCFSVFKHAHVRCGFDGHSAMRTKLQVRKMNKRCGASRHPSLENQRALENPHNPAPQGML